MPEIDQAPAKAPFGLNWDDNRRTVRERFGGLSPAAEAEHALSYPLIELAERIWAEGGFCPGPFVCAPERNGDEVTFQFSDDRLNAVFMRFGYAFGHIGQDPDTLSELAMSNLARAELHKLIFEMSVKYGAPKFLHETQGRSGPIHVQGTALFDPEGHGLIQLLFGHDGGAALMGEIWYHARCTQLAGF